MATDLKKVLSITGQSGLFNYLAQTRNGVIVEALATGHRTAFSGTMKMTTLADVSIYTEDDELPLKEVFTKMHEVLGDQDAPSPKSDEKAIKEFFASAVNYDRDRFYLSHMKKVLEWYNLLKNYASLDFVDDDEESAELPKEEEKPEAAARIAAAKQPKAPAKATANKAATAKAASTKKSTKSVQRKAN